MFLHLENDDTLVVLSEGRGCLSEQLDSNLIFDPFEHTHSFLSLVEKNCNVI